MRIVAIIAVYNEELMIEACIQHYKKHGILVYLIDNQSVDSTVQIAKQYLDHGIIAIETLARHGCFSMINIMQRKEDLAKTLAADWFIHADADEFLAPSCGDGGKTLHDAIVEVDHQGYNAINFFEYTFVPTVEHPAHEDGDFQQSMKWYYPFARNYPHRVIAWKKIHRLGLSKFKHMPLVRSVLKRKHCALPVDLVSKAGHQVKFANRKLFPRDFIMKHYLCLSIDHAVKKYCERKHDARGLARGWHGWREQPKAQCLKLPSERVLRSYVSDDSLDCSNHLREHLLYKGVAESKND